MADLPASKTALRRLAARASSMARSRASAARERKETRYEYGGAFLLLPVARNLLAEFEILDLGLDEKLRVALITGFGATMTSGAMSDALRGASLGAVGAYTWDAKGMLAGLFGKK